MIDLTIKRAYNPSLGRGKKQYYQHLEALHVTSCLQPPAFNLELTSNVTFMIIIFLLFSIILPPTYISINNIVYFCMALNVINESYLIRYYVPFLSL